MHKRYTKEEDNLLIELSKQDISFDEIYNKFNILLTYRSYESVKTRFYRRLKLNCYNKITYYTKEEIEFIKRNVNLYRENGYLNITKFAHVFNSKFNRNINEQRLRDLRCRAKIRMEKPNYKEVMATKDMHKMPIGSERDINGYKFVKVKKINDNTITQCKKRYINWKPKQVHIYEQHHKVEVKPNQMVAFMDKNKNNFNIENLMLVDRKELGKMIRFQHIKDLEIRKTIFDVCKTECMIEDLERLGKRLEVRE